MGIPSYDPQRIVDIARFVWWDSTAPGALVPHGVTSLPVQLFQSSLSRLGLPYFMIQAILFWVLLFLSGLGMSLSARSLFGKNNILIFASGLFYMLNPYMMIQVWHRFIHNSFFLAAFLPFFYLFWDGWIKKGRRFHLFLFLLFNIFGVYLYGTIAYIVTVLLVLIFILVKNVLIPWEGFDNFKKLLLRFTAGLTAWFLIHAFWLLPTFNITPALFSGQHRTYESANTLITLSRQTVIPYVLSGINPFYLFEQADFGKIYTSPAFMAMIFLPLVFAVPGFISAVTSKKYSSWGILFVTAVFLAKGAAPPFGYLFILALSTFFPLGVLRNPFEKIGILLPFSMAVISALGLRWYLKRFKGKAGVFLRAGLILVLILQLVIFLWPFWTGRLIGKWDKPALVEIPGYYREADKYIKDQKKTGKLLHLPLPEGEAVSYKWPYPFSGIESSQLIFSSLPSISRGQNIKHIDDIVSAAAGIFREGSEEKIAVILKHLNVRFIILHRDVVWEGGFHSDPAKLEAILDKQSFWGKKNVIGELVIYEIKEEFFTSRIFTAYQAELLSGGLKNSLWPYLLAESNGVLISAPGVGNIDYLGAIAIPVEKFLFHEEKIPLEKAIQELPAASKILPGSKAYFLIRLKENLKILTSMGPEKTKLMLDMMGKRLVEAVRMQEKGLKNWRDPLRDYKQSLDELTNKGKLKDQFDFLGGKEVVRKIFMKHLSVVNALGDASAAGEITEAMREAGLIPLSEIKPDRQANDPEYTVYHFEVPLDGEYELVMAQAKTSKVYPDELKKLKFQLDGEEKELEGSEINGFISFGKIRLKEGKREIIVPALSSVNLAKEKESNVFSFEPLTYETWYSVKFEAKIESGQFRLQLMQDGLTDFEKVYSREGDGFRKYREGIFFGKPAVQNAEIKFSEEENGRTVFRNVSIERLLNNPVFLRSSLKAENFRPGLNAEFTQKNPVYYSGRIKLDMPGLLIFSESYHDGWQLRLKKNNKTDVPKQRLLANMYANAWFIEESGEYSFELEFLPQRIFNKGLIISLVAFLIIAAVLLKRAKK